MNFPKSEAEIHRLAQDVAKGLSANQDAFPAPPVPPEHIEQALEAYNGARDAAIRASAAATEGAALQDKALDTLVKMLKSDLHYAEDITRQDSGKLQLLGWDGMKARSATEPPGQVITLQVEKAGKTWIQLDWRKPFDGGKVAAYKIQRRKREGGEWTDVATAMEPGITLDGQDGGVEWEYRVIAVNKSGEGPASNIVTAIA